MITLIENMIQYSRTGKKELLISSDISMETKDINVIIIKILSWLKLEHKRTMWRLEGKKVMLKPLPLDIQYPWCNNLIFLIDKEESFKNCFEVIGNELNFRESVNEEERQIARKIAFDNYNPPKMT